MTQHIVTADASRVSPQQFLDSIGLDSPARRAARRAEMQGQCIRAIERGDTYGWPALMVAGCREIMDAQLTETHGDPLLKRGAA